MRRIAYFFNQAVASFRDAPAVSILTVGTIGATLLVAGAYLMALQNIEGLALVWGRNATVSAVLADGLQPNAQHDLVRRIAAMKRVERAELVTPAQALARFRARGEKAAALVEGVTEDVLPASIEIDLRPGFADLTALENVSAHLSTLDSIVEVDYGQQELEQLQALLDLLRYVGLAAGFLIAAATAFIVSNTIRLTVYARRDEIAILRLVGATNWFVRMPFLIEGMLWGLGGGMLASGALWLGELLLATQVTAAVREVIGGLRVHFINGNLTAGLLVCGAILGALGSALAVGRFLEVEAV